MRALEGVFTRRLLRGANWLFRKLQELERSATMYGDLANNAVLVIMISVWLVTSIVVFWVLMKANR